ncbi:MAG: hypothetical protein ONB48_03155 [candidate division KSB1 bacterium]|nr:hypothetical protein [candidate division KSB1 bacterium]MDZ7275664.1 hypothetical protein [candidate division KSB1 bacterium]MDZ7284645.1 hypothetical protein [candidate division KSB1 bacterium]MDZ7297936.1 hypothetical protein [candidate division KSB1 bacterium]MDZ7307099.1 hypothetical protein [candidate division KSB1 bacterium]
MFMRLWGSALLLLGLSVIAEGSFHLLQRDSGLPRWLYVALGVVLVVRGLYLTWPFHKQPPADGAA